MCLMGLVGRMVMKVFKGPRQRAAVGVVIAAAVIAASTGAASAATVVVERGQTLTSLASSHDTTVSALAALNKLGNPNYIQVGQRLSLPDSVSGGPSSSAPSSSALPSARLDSGIAVPSPAARARYLPLFERWAAAYHVPASLLEALTWWESGWQPNVVSSTGAIGIGQLEPSTIRFVRDTLVHDPHLDPRSAPQNIQMSSAFLAYLMASTHGRPDLALAAYYQGLASVRKHGVLPGTRNYVIGIMRYQRLFSL
jgi:soluble lytic murein transglycosylase-like protein